MSQIKFYQENWGYCNITDTHIFHFVNNNSNKKHSANHTDIHKSSDVKEKDKTTLSAYKGEYDHLGACSRLLLVGVAENESQLAETTAA